MLKHFSLVGGRPSLSIRGSATEGATQNMALTDKGDNTIYLRDVKKQVGPLQVLAGINLEVRRGEVVVFIGPSGSGKTTLLRCVAGLESCEAGEIVVFGRRVRSTWQLKGQVGFVF